MLLTGALDLSTGIWRDCWGPHKTNGLLRDLLQTLDEAYPVAQFQRVSGVVDNYKIHKAKAVDQWLANQPRVTLLFLPTYCPHANPSERASGDVPDGWTRNHRRSSCRLR